MNPVAVGTLPEDLIHAIRGGGVAVEQTDSNTVVFHDTLGGVEWQCALQPGDLCSYRNQQTGLNGSAEISRFVDVKKIELSNNNKTISAPAPVIEDTDQPPPLVSVSADTPTPSEVMHTHRSLAVKVAHMLAPAPRDHRELLRSLSTEKSDAVNAVLDALTVLNRRGQRELHEAGYELVDIESYNSKAVKQQVANLALPKIAHNKVIMDRFAVYADRDVMLAVCSRGIMAGLGGAKQKRVEDDDDDSDDADVIKGRSAEEPLAKKATMVLFTSMDQCGIRWSDGDLSNCPQLLTLPPTVKEILAQRHEAEAGTAGKCLRPMPIVNASQLATAQGRYGILQREHQRVYSLLKRAEEVTEAARGWCQSNSMRISELLAEEMRQWFAAQEEPREVLVAALEVLHKELYQLKCEIEDYVNLRECGVLA